VSRRFEKNCPIFVNVAKTVAKTSKIEVKVQNVYTQPLFNVNISTTNHVLKLLILVNLEKSQMVKFSLIEQHIIDTNA
jgi:hypothetical protein